jgi:hypothetical protein
LVAESVEPPAAKMTAAAQKFLDTLNPELKKQASFSFDDKERLHWNFVPLQDKDRSPTRKGARLEEMSPEQQKAALELLKTGTGSAGFDQASTIMSLEEILKNLEKQGAMVRNTGWYFVTVFGTPANTGDWGWRWEGHHLSLNFTIHNGQVVSATPYFFGSNPADVKDGARKGLKVLGGVMDSAVELFDSLDAEQKKAALQAKQFPEIDAIPAAKVGTPVGLPAGKLTDAQKGKLRQLLQAYAKRWPDAVAEAYLKRVDDAGFDKVHFAFARQDDKPGKPYTYQVQGPTFVVQFLNIQADSAGNPANHVHSVWRELPGDFAVAK